MNSAASLFIVCMAVFASMCPQSFAKKPYVRTRSEQCIAEGFVGACIQHYPLAGGDKYYEKCDQLACAVASLYSTMGGANHRTENIRVPDEGTNAGRLSYCSNGNRVSAAREDMPSERDLFPTNTYRCE